MKHGRKNFDQETKLTSRLPQLFEAALTAKGGGLMTYAELHELTAMASARRLVVQSVEAYEVSGDTRWARMDATFSYPHEDYAETAEETITKTVAALNDLLSTVPDCGQLHYLVWIDPDPI